MNIANNSPRPTVFRMGTSVRDFWVQIATWQCRFRCVLVRSHFFQILSNHKVQNANTQTLCVATQETF